MSSLGIGIGAFASGLAGGYGLGLQMEDAQARREQRKSERAQQRQVEDLQTEVNTEFDRRVQAGEANPEDAYKFWASYGAPRKASLLTQQGRYADANELTKWTESDAARQGSRLFASSLFKAQSGDLRGAIDDAVEAGQVKGYLDHSYKIDDEQPIKDKDGKITGYRVVLKDADGVPLEWEVTPDNVVDGIATLFNPEAAFQTHLDARAAREKAKLDVSTYGEKEEIKDKFARGRAVQAHELKLKESAAGSGAQPAEVKAAEWLAANTAAAAGREVTPQDKIAAHQVIRQAKDNPNARAGLVVRVYDAMAKDIRDKRPPEEKRKDAAAFVDQLLSDEPQGAGPGGGGSGAPGLGGEDIGSAANPYRPTSDEEYSQIPVGAIYIDPDDGKPYKKQAR